MRYRARIAFTLIELLVVIAVIAVLAAILFPVFARVRDKARQTACVSNLKQLGTAFSLYAPDYDGVYPCPGGYLFGRTIQSAWLLSSGPGFNRDIGGLWPYIRQRGNAGMSNVWSCPNALPGPGNVFSPGQNFVMNDYLRACHPGEAYYPHHDTVCGFGWATGINPDLAPNAPAQVILLFEAAQHATDHNVNRDGSPFFQTGPSATPPLCMGMPQNYHAGKSSFLFCDSHIKTLMPGATWTPDEQSVIRHLLIVSESTNRPRCGTVDAALAIADFQGSGERSLWDPGGTRYP